MSIICVANNKGGVGKTVISLNLIHHIKPDLIIDADIHKGITNLLALGDSTIEIRHATDKQQIIDWAKTDKTVLIDCGGFDSDITRYAMSQSDYIVTPTNDDPTEQFALIEFNKVMAAVSEMVGERLSANILLNRVHHSRSDFKDLDGLLNDLEYLNRLSITIPQSALLPKAAFNGKAVTTGAVGAKFNKLAKQITNTLKDS